MIAGVCALSRDDAFRRRAEQGDRHGKLLGTGEIATHDRRTAGVRRGDDPGLQRAQVALEIPRRDTEVDDTKARLAAHCGDVTGIHQEALASQLTGRQPTGLEVDTLDQRVDREQPGLTATADDRTVLPGSNECVAIREGASKEFGQKAELANGSDSAS